MASKRIDFQIMNSNGVISVKVDSIKISTSTVVKFVVDGYVYRISFDRALESMYFNSNLNVSIEVQRDNMEKVIVNGTYQSFEESEESFKDSFYFRDEFFLSASPLVEIAGICVERVFPAENYNEAIEEEAREEL